MKYLALILTSFMLVHCTSEKEKQTDTQPKMRTVEIAKDLKATQYMTIYFSGQPSNENFAELKNAGFTTIINLREDGEGIYSEGPEKEAVESAGLQYIHIPMNGRDQLDDKMIQKITESVVANRDTGKMLIHCGTGNRAALWAGGHFYRDHKFSKKEAMSIAKSLGLTSSGLQENLDKYLNQ